MGWTKTFITKSHSLFISATVLLTLISSCQENFEAKKSAIRNASMGSNIDGAVRVYESNPAILTGNTNASSPGWEKYLTWASITENPYLNDKCQFKQDNYVSEVETSFPCFEVSKNNMASLTGKNTDGSWNYSVDSEEFYEVNTYYHVNKLVDRFLKTFEFIHDYTHQQSSLFIPPATKYNIAATQSFWLGDNGTASTLDVYSQCEMLGEFGTDINAYFSPALNHVCMGWNPNKPGLFMAQDPSVIYHEMGHAFVKIMMNQRNTVVTNAVIDNYISVDYKSDLGLFAYDEAGALNEGIADFFSYYITNRKYMGEWGGDRVPALIFESQGYVGQKFGRPMDEDSYVHASGISSDVPGEKLSYPKYLNYNSHAQDQRFASVNHYGGQIVSHYLVRLTDNFKDKCSFDSGSLADLKANVSSDQEHFAATSMVILLLNETFAEIGDLTAKGSDYFNEYAISGLDNVFFTNLNADESYLWAHYVTPPDMRRFFKLFAKNIKYYVSDSLNGLCPAFSVDDSEALLDEYGLLLFKSYGDAGQGMYIDANGDGTTKKYEDYDYNYLLGSSPFIAASSSTEVNELNRKQTILVSKDYIDLPTDGRVQAYIFDKRSSIENLLANLTFEGNTPVTSTNIADVKYNNENINISPGEIVGVSLNLVNNSNSTMSGVQVLANDWDHMKLKDSSDLFVNRMENITHSTYSNEIATWEPCQIDGWPMETEGGVLWDPADPQAQGDCGYTTRTNRIMKTVTDGTTTYPYYDLDAPQPICMVQFSDENETKWVSQDYYRKNVLGLEDHECLNNESSGIEFNPNECLIRVIPATSSTMFGRIEPQKTWLETIAQNGNPKPEHSSGNLNLMEVSKWIQPGTSFNCRFRVRFTNCLDCYNDSNSGEDYADYEYAGLEPFKVINFSFTVVD